MALGAATALGVAGTAALASCGSSSSTATPASGSAAGGAGAPTSGGSAAGSSGALAKLSDLPVGKAVNAAGPNGTSIIIAQPTAGTVVAFSAKCTHAGCKVLASGSTLECPCHGSTFDLATGKNLSGPAPSPLPAVAVKVSGTDIVAG
jgi:Rieske Fe-S protein